MSKVFDYICNGGSEADKLAASHEYLEGVLGGVLAERDELLTALRRIASLDEKNVPKYAQQIARDALK